MDVEKRVQKEMREYNVEDLSLTNAFNLIKYVLTRYEWRNELVKEICNTMLKKILRGDLNE